MVFIFVPEKISFANYVIRLAAAWIIICPLLLSWLSWMSPEDIYGGLLLFSLSFLKVTSSTTGSGIIVEGHIIHKSFAVYSILPKLWPANILHCVYGKCNLWPPYTFFFVYQDRNKLISTKMVC